MAAVGQWDVALIKVLDSPDIMLQRKTSLFFSSLTQSYLVCGEWSLFIPEL